MSTSSFKGYQLCKPVFSFGPLVNKIPSHFITKQWSEPKREFIRVTSSYFTHTNRKNAFICCTDKRSEIHSKLDVLRNNTRPYTSIPDLPGKPLNNDNTLSLPQKFVESLPAQYRPYLKLSRIDRPIGTWLLFWPSTWGLTVASGGIPDLTLLALFGAGAFVMRGAGCTVNDMWDRHIDPKVKRTSSRPLAAGQIRMRYAALWLGSQLSVAFGILLQLNPSCFLVSCGALGLVCLYPLAKRVTNWPQAVLGLTFNTGILIGYAAASPLNTGFFDIPYLDASCLSLYVSGILWTLIYDTIYAHQDLQDDTLLGLGSTARRFGENTKFWLTGFSGLMISSLTVAGITADMSWPYYVGITGVAAHLLWQVKTLNIRNATNCGERFNSNRNIGWLILFSLLASYWVKDIEGEKQTKISKKSLDTNDSVSVQKYTGLVQSSI